MSPRARAAAGAAVCAAVVVATWLVAVRTTAGQVVENAAKDGPYVRRWWVPDAGADMLEGWATVAVVAGMAAVVTWTARHRGARPTAVVVAVVGGSLAVAEVLKVAVFDRPGLITAGDPHYLAVLAHNSYPSGHTTA
ncbi:MAG TPA: hypothetical protein VFI47_14230, partial [Acidimicrobiales bacterium]|nr:hypothetical protein [Acidimicrobiales bacterium]